MKGFKDSNNKFHPITDYKKGVRKSRDQTAKLQGVRMKRSLSSKNKLEKAIKILEHDFNFEVEEENMASTKNNKVFSVVDNDEDIDQETYNEKTLIDRAIELMENNDYDEKDIKELED